MFMRVFNHGRARLPTDFSGENFRAIFLVTGKKNQFHRQAAAKV
jgi:hypothetical protein